MTLNVGFTGTQRGLDKPQRQTLVALLTRLQRLGGKQTYNLLHGDCVGADTEAAEIAKGLGFTTQAFPGPDPARRGGFVSDRVALPMPFMDRNRVIAIRSHVLVATPKEAQETLRSGTWATVRYARDAERPIYLIPPSGRLDAEWPVLHDRITRTGISLNEVR